MLILEKTETPSFVHLFALLRRICEVSGTNCRHRGLS
jgi:hypothetical protein